MNNSIPALERAIQVLERLSEHSAGLSAVALAEQSGIPRTTLYRILRMLAGKGYVSVSGANTNAYVLGPALARLASRVPIHDDLAARAKPVMHALSAKLAETTKLVVREGIETLTTAVVHSGYDARIASRVGTRLPLYVGASQRLLLSRAPDEIIEAVLAGSLKPYASGTITKARELRAIIQRLKTQDWETGRNEGPEGVGTVAALVSEPGVELRAALVVVFVERGKCERDIHLMRDATVEAARALSEA
ncbi:MAG: IclR family transcriptional regulator [Pusillimonas sp.]